MVFEIIEEAPHTLREVVGDDIHFVEKILILNGRVTRSHSGEQRLDVPDFRIGE
jgi:hypothetical protein